MHRPELSGVMVFAMSILIISATGAAETNRSTYLLPLTPLSLRKHILQDPEVGTLYNWYPLMPDMMTIRTANRSLKKIINSANMYAQQCNKIIKSNTITQIIGITPFL